MASVSSVVTRGFGSPGSASLVITRGFGLGEAETLGGLVCASITVRPRLNGTVAIRPRLGGAVTIRGTVAGEVEMGEC